MTRAKQVRLHPEMDDFIEGFHQKVVDAMGNKDGERISKPMSSGILAKGLKELGVMDKIDVVKVQGLKKRRSSLDVRLFF